MRWLRGLALLGMIASAAAASEPADAPQDGGAVEAARSEERSLLERAWREARDGAQWRSPTMEERRVLRSTMGELLEGAPSCSPERIAEADERLRRVDLSATYHPADGGGIVIVQEVVERRGSGVYAVRCGDARPVAWQAPHAFFDLRTESIARSLFVETGARLGMWSTIHRYRALPGEDRADPVHPADVTREAGSLFQAATVGAAVGDPSLRFVQIHGFAADARELDVILSSGDPMRPPALDPALLIPRFGRVGVYAVDTETLGATRNVQGRALRTVGPGRFLHVELALPVRDVLTADAEARRTLAEALLGRPW